MTLPYPEDFTSQAFDYEETFQGVDPFCVQAALRYAEHAGWAVLWLAEDSTDGGKLPPRNCARCDYRIAGPEAAHDKAMCSCLTCHGFHAGTRDPGRIRAAYQKVRGMGRVPHLAVATGRLSRLLVLDAEAGEGVETLDRFGEATNGEVFSLPQTLTARSVSGGVHLFYLLPTGWEGRVKSGRVLKDVDVKCEGGYVGVVDGQTQRAWVDVGVPMVEAPTDLLEWLTKGKRLGPGGGATGGGSGGGIGSGYNFKLFLEKGCPDGFRDHFFNDLAFRLRKRGAGLAEMVEVCWEAWQKVAQPPDARWEMPWQDVESKIHRVHGEVSPDSLTNTQSSWVKGVASGNGSAGTRVKAGSASRTDIGGALSHGAQRRVGNVVVVGRDHGQLNKNAGQ